MCVRVCACVCVCVCVCVCLQRPDLQCDSLRSDAVHVTHGGEDVNLPVVRHTVNDVMQHTEQAASGRSIAAKCPDRR